MSRFGRAWWTTTGALVRSTNQPLIPSIFRPHVAPLVGRVPTADAEPEGVAEQFLFHLARSLVPAIFISPRAISIPDEYMYHGTLECDACVRMPPAMHRSIVAEHL